MILWAKKIICAHLKRIKIQWMAMLAYINAVNIYIFNIRMRLCSTNNDHQLYKIKVMVVQL